MVKATLKVGGLLEKAKSVNVFKNGIWQNEQMGYVYYQGVWIPFIEYIKWVFKSEADDNYEFRQNRGSSDLFRVFSDRFYIRSVATNDHQWSSSEAMTLLSLDLTNYSKIIIDWEHLRQGNATSTPNASLFVRRKGAASIGTDADPGRNSDARIVSMTLGRYVSTLDISSLMGDYTIHASNVPGSIHTNGSWVVNVYNMWLE